MSEKVQLYINTLLVGRQFPPSLVLMLKSDFCVVPELEACQVWPAISYMEVNTLDIMEGGGF
jgi:hypothetical protein